jgi:hypothetical protein
VAKGKRRGKPGERLAFELGPVDVLLFSAVAERERAWQAALHRIFGFIDAELMELDKAGKAALLAALSRRYAKARGRRRPRKGVEDGSLPKR